MGRRRNKKKPPSPPSPTSSVAVVDTKEKEEEEEAKDKDLDKKLVYTSIFKNRESSKSWIMIDPNCDKQKQKQKQNENLEDVDCSSGIRFELIPEMEFPAHLDLHKFYYYGCAVFDSKVYFIGGLAGSLISPKYYSKKVFIYDLASKKWEEDSSQLNVARAFHKVVVIENVIYVFGGITTETDSSRRTGIMFTEEQWIECYNPNKKMKKWELLPTSSAPPLAVLKAETINFVAVYERRSEILFFFHITGVFSFNYVAKTWKDCRQCHPSLNKCASIKCDQVAVVDDILFRHYFGRIYAYDLSQNRMLFSHSLRDCDFAKMPFGDPEFCCNMPGTTFLVRVAKETLLLICWDDMSPSARNNITPQLHCYKFQIQKSPSSQEGQQEQQEQDSRFDFDLNNDKCAFFLTPGRDLDDCVLV